MSETNPRYIETVVLADSQSLTAGTAVTGDTGRIKAPVVCVELEDLEGAADDTVTVEIGGDVGTYEIEKRTLSATGSFVVGSVQAATTKVTSANGVTYSVEVRGNPN